MSSSSRLVVEAARMLLAPADTLCSEPPGPLGPPGTAGPPSVPTELTDVLTGAVFSGSVLLELLSFTWRFFLSINSKHRTKNIPSDPREKNYKIWRTEEGGGRG